MENLQTHPLKLYIQDIYRASQSPENKYIYNIFDLTFKNLHIHGIVTEIYNKTSTSTNLEVTDPTGSVQIYYDSTKNNSNINLEVVKQLKRDLVTASRYNDQNIHIMSTLTQAVSMKKQKPLDFEEGSYVSVIGDIFVEDLRNLRMVSAYECKVTSVERDIVWLEELRYLYEKFYLWSKENISVTT